MEALCFSQHLFPLLPFIIATQGDREGAQILLGPPEWVSCGDWKHGEQGAGMIMGATTSGRLSCTGELSCLMVKEMYQLFRRRNKLPLSAWNLLLSDSSALVTLKVKKSNSCSKKDLLFECAELHSPETQHWNTLEGRRGSFLFPSPERKRAEEGNPWSCCSESPTWSLWWNFSGEKLVL